MHHFLIRFMLKIAFGALFFVIGLLIGLIGVIFYPYRLLVLAISKVFRPDLVGFVRGAANITFVFGSDTTVPTANICVCLILDGVLTVEELRDRFKKKVVDVCRPDGSRPYDKLKQTITKFMNFPFYRWVKDFNLNEHVRPYDYKGPLALPTDEVTEKDIQRIAGKLISLPYATLKSNWEFLIVDNFVPASTRDRTSLVVIRMSHAMADGYSIQGLIQSLSDQPDLILKFEQPPQKSKSNSWTKLWNMAVLPGKMLWDAGTQTVDLMIDECCWKIQREDGERAENMAVFTKGVHVDVIKAIKNIHRVNYASVLLTALSSSIHRVMKDSGQKIPNKMYCILPAPKPNHPGGLTNYLLASLLPLPIVPHATPSSIAQIDAHFKNVINSKATLLSELILEMNAFLPLFLAKYLYCALYASAAVGIFPVVPHGPTFDKKLLSDGITFVGCLGWTTTNGATISMGGVNNIQRISICMDKRAFPNQDVFGCLPGYIEDEIERMKKSCKSQNRASLYGLADVKKRA